ncbi:uncharacterized protein LOC127450833 isoform X2 [Myxocyprinus asiaticus]|uniref:uncharacterized protein LOC127450833 isoform X2 n=1 Tax=Myxocyprinus asiaticus TaxID=70543 RepID=UPI0022214EA8|nr:uncharacterized protein LOC127450833 isoform X2 [Myxocyprinus asiaticus]
MSKSFQLQLSSIMEIMTKTAMEEICKLVNRDFAFLQQELSRVMSENTVLKDKMFCLESEVESTRITKLEPRAGSKIYRSICVQTEYGVQPSIKRIFGKEWCSSLWDRRIERREDKLAIDVDQHMGQDCSNQLFIKEENLEVDTYTSYTGKIPQASRAQSHSSALEPCTVKRPEVAESKKYNDCFVSGGFSEISAIQTTFSDSSEKHSLEITLIDETGEQLIAPIDDPLESDGYYILDEFSGPGPSEARDDGSSQKIYGYDVTTAESCEKRFKKKESHTHLGWHEDCAPVWFLTCVTPLMYLKLTKTPEPLGTNHLFNKINIPDRILAIDPSLPAQECADNYAAELSKAFSTKQIPVFDMLLLSLGPDGHTCSPFPDHPLLQEVLESGEGPAFPAALVSPRQVDIFWLLDEPAAASLTSQVERPCPGAKF